MLETFEEYDYRPVYDSLPYGSSEANQSDEGEAIMRSSFQLAC